MKRCYFLILLCLHLVSPTFGELSIKEKIEGRSRPSIFAAWANWFVNKPDMPYAEMTAAHDLFWSPSFGLRFQRTGTDVQLAGDSIEARRQRDELLELNPNIICLLQINMRGADPNSWHLKELYDGDDFPFIVENGELVLGSPPEEYTDILIDFTHPTTKKIIINQVIAVANTGLWDGVLFDFWNEKGVVLGGYRTYEAEQQARIDILKGIRAGVRDDFLILVNGLSITEKTAPYINGTFMETFRGQRKNYNHQGLEEMGNELLWAEENLREPRINCLEGEGIGSELPTSLNNLRDMRLLTTLSLTHSDGFVLYTMGVGWGEQHPHDSTYLDYQGAAFHRNPRYWIRHREQHDTLYHLHHHEHDWHNFWDADLGRPISAKAQTYKGREGLFIREFTNGWAVYNRSGKEQKVELPQEVSGWSSGVKNQRRHTLPDLDGEIYLKTIPKVEPGEYPPLYWIDTKTNTLQHLVDAEVKNLVSGTQNATSLTVDTATEKLYWTEKTSNRTGKIQRANLDSTNVQLVKDLTSAPLDITLDTAGGKLYLSNAWGKIQRMNLDGSNFQSNLITGLQSPQNLVLDSVDGKLYWTEQLSKTTGKVQCANIDGSNVQLVKELTSAPRGMMLDVTNRKLYLTNGWGKLQRMNLDGSNFQPNFIIGLEDPGQVVVDRVGGKVYWTEKGKLRRADLNGENIQDVVTGLGELTDIGLGIDSVGEMDVAAAPAITTTVEQTQLLANYPNPFNPETWIPYQLAEPAEVTVRIYSVNGILVRTLVLGQMSTGIYQNRSRAAYWDGRNDVGESVASGIYFYTLTAGDFTATRKLLIRK